MAVKDYYRILNVNVNAPDYTIKSNYRKLAMKYHPDRNPDDELAAAVFTDITEAYSVLCDEEKRKRYNYQRYLLAPQDYVKPAETIEELLIKSAALYSKLQLANALHINRDALLYALQQLIPHQEIKQSDVLQHHLQNLLKSAAYLTVANAVQLQKDLQLLLQKNTALNAQLTSTIQLLRRSERWEGYKILIAVAVTALLCIIIFKLSR